MTIEGAVESSASDRPDAASTAGPRAQQQPLPVLRLRYLVLIGASTLVFPFLLVFMLLQPCDRSRGPVWALGVLVLLRGAGAVGGSVLASRVSATVGSARVLVGTQSAVVFCMALLALAPSQPMLVLFVAMSFANGLMRPVLSALLKEIPSEQRATIISLQALLWTVFLAVVEPALFALVERTSLPLGIGVSAVVLAAVASGLLALWCLMGRSTVDANRALDREYYRDRQRLPRQI